MPICQWTCFIRSLLFSRYFVRVEITVVNWITSEWSCKSREIAARATLQLNSILQQSKYSKWISFHFFAQRFSNYDSFDIGYVGARSTINELSDFFYQPIQEKIEAVFRSSCCHDWSDVESLCECWNVVPFRTNQPNRFIIQVGMSFWFIVFF